MSIWSHLLCKPNMITIHIKCRNTDLPYIRSSIHRVQVPDEKLKWSVDWKEYNPPDYTDPAIEGKPWADDNLLHNMKWNAVDGKINRKSHFSTYAFDGDSRPLNPIGRTGLRGRGTLGRWGPNHAADPLVTRIHQDKLQFVAIQRSDSGEWAIPGGMVDAGEVVSQTLKREFSEETLGGVSPANLEQLWSNGKNLYSGYVDDPRNTDNAWMETVVMNFHDDTRLLENTKLQAGDDAVNVKWIDVDNCQNLYASHNEFINILKAYHVSKA